ncbi:MAG: coproporphyrinogen III oxidase family protein [Gammaproteobacteria bacterium]|nr:coproporphyrinogen III oxidase family protein [Gammaproteobacteria bacterium]MBT7372316.1 coproporphyrinogen III oxidase family protein [Gammaproteobacteria bacterium]
MNRWLLNRAADRLLSFGDESSLLQPVPEADRSYLLYVHIPFCARLCPYCSFHRVVYDADLATRYFGALRAEIKAYAELGFNFSDVYVGGGTPTVNIPELVSTLNLVNRLFDIKSISVETNPDHLDARTSDALLACGVNRLSVGVQSFDDRQLNRMGRLDTYGTGREIQARLSGIEGKFSTVNVDMIFNLPGQTEATLSQDIKMLLDSGVGQASFYPLMITEATRSQVTRDMGIFSLGQERAFYNQILDGMSGTHKPSSVWCFSRDGDQIDEYIVDHDEFVGVGSGAFSYLDGVFYANSFSILRYDELLTAQDLGITRCRPLQQWEQRYYGLLTGLFGLTLSAKQLKSIYGDSYPAALELLTLTGIIEKKAGLYCLTGKGRYQWLVAMSVFLNGVNNLREQMRAHIHEEVQASLFLP